MYVGVIVDFGNVNGGRGCWVLTCCQSTSLGSLTVGYSSLPFLPYFWLSEPIDFTGPLLGQWCFFPKRSFRCFSFKLRLNVQAMFIYGVYGCEAKSKAYGWF